jgi:NTE family protein
VTTGVPLAELYERQVSGAGARPERPPDLGRLMEFFAARSGTNGAVPTSREVLAWIGAQARRCSTRVTEAARLQVIKSRLPVHEWPERALLVTAIDTADGSLVQWRRESGVPLPVAVASSCAVPWIYPPVTIGGRRYMDGGMRSVTNADLARGHDLVVILAPLAALGRTPLLDAEVDALRAAGSRVELVIPDEASVDAIGPNPLDPARGARAAAAGRAQAATAAEELAEIRAHLG